MPTSYEALGRVMGTDAHVVVVGERALVDGAHARLADLERRWSRFRPASEISRLNGLPGHHVVVSPDTFTLVARAVDAWRATGGLFDPTVLPALRSAGYDRDFSEVPARTAGATPPAPQPAPGCAGIVLDADVHAVTLPAGVEIDPGGIGKGLAADLVSAEVIDAGAHGALVNVGGDLRVRGEPPNGRTWDVAVVDPESSLEILRVGLHDGAVATSSRMRRRWPMRAGEMHHLIDPRTGAPSVTPHATVAAIAHEGWWAEVAAKTVLVGGLSLEDARPLGALLTIVSEDGVISRDPGLEQFAA